jgi:hypothetical protein
MCEEYVRSMQGVDKESVRTTHELLVDSSHTPD